MTTSSQSSTKVPVGPTSIAGWLVAGLSFAAAAVSFLTGDHTAQTTLVPGLLGLGGVSHLTTSVGRYVQSNGQLKLDLAKVVSFAGAQLPSLEEELAARPPVPVPVPPGAPAATAPLAAAAPPAAAPGG